MRKDDGTSQESGGGTAESGSDDFREPASVRDAYDELMKKEADEGEDK